MFSSGRWLDGARIGQLAKRLDSVPTNVGRVVTENADQWFDGAKIAQLLDGLAHDPEGQRTLEAAVFDEIRDLTARFPIYDAV